MKLLAIEKKGVQPTLITRAWHRVQERVRSPATRGRLAKMITWLRPRGAPANTDIGIAELKKHGVCMMPGFMNDAEIAKLRTALSEFNCFDPWREHLGEFRHDQIPQGTHVAQIPCAAQIEQLHAIAYDRRLIDLVTAYFGCRPYLDSIQAWWSVSGNDEPEEAENFHRDNDSIRFLKFFLYATEVGEENGPHVFVAGSHVQNTLTEHRRLSDSEVKAAFGVERIRIMTGKAGDAFMEDTFGIHKGQLPKSGKRLLIQFRYSVTESIFRSPLIVAPAADIQPELATSLIND